jgi:hypothetical protein
VEGVPQAGFDGGLGDEQVLGDLPGGQVGRGEAGDPPFGAGEGVRAGEGGAPGRAPVPTGSRRGRAPVPTSSRRGRAPVPTSSRRAGAASGMAPVRWARSRARRSGIRASARRPDGRRWAPRSARVSASSYRAGVGSSADASARDFSECSRPADAACARSAMASVAGLLTFRASASCSSASAASCGWPSAGCAAAPLRHDAMVGATRLRGTRGPHVQVRLRLPGWPSAPLHRARGGQTIRWRTSHRRAYRLSGWGVSPETCDRSGSVGHRSRSVGTSWKTSQTWRRPKSMAPG